MVSKTNGTQMDFSNHMRCKTVINNKLYWILTFWLWFCCVVFIEFFRTIYDIRFLGFSFCRMSILFVSSLCDRLTIINHILIWYCFDMAEVKHWNVYCFVFQWNESHSFYQLEPFQVVWPYAAIENRKVWMFVNEIIEIHSLEIEIHRNHFQ